MYSEFGEEKTGQAGKERHNVEGQWAETVCQTIFTSYSLNSRFISTKSGMI